MRSVGLFVLSLCAVVALGSSLSAGPVRDWIRDHRPGVIFPKTYNAPVQPGSVIVGPSPSLCPCPVCPCPVTPAKPVAPPGCPGGVCPVPKTPAKPAEATFSALPVGPVTVENAP